ncbi:hypothetical protein HZS_3063 [Henneguya salminicola]|nr:hypothetical protein HZS_3063 [Henneguya salminicola]
MENVQSKRGKEKYNHEGHFYVFDKLSEDRSKKFWRCELVMSAIKMRATDTTEIPSVSLNGALQQTSTTVHAKMPNKEAIRIVIQRRRFENQAAPIKTRRPRFNYPPERISDL